MRTRIALLVAVAGLACTRAPAHACRSDAECAIGWSCVNQFCQLSTTMARDAATNTTDGRDASISLDSSHDRTVHDVSPPVFRTSLWNYMFVTSQNFGPASFGSLSAADAACDLAALGGGLESELTGNYRAWLSSSTTAARDRLAGARGWIRVDGLPFVDTVDDLVAGQIVTPPIVDEFAEPRGIGNDWLVMTGTEADGTASPGNTCADWTATNPSVRTGNMRDTAEDWTANWTRPCDGYAFPIYCFGIDKNLPLPPPIPTPGRRAFASNAAFSGSGIDAADAQCSSEAVAAGLPATFKALLTTSTASAASRFVSSASTVWVRLDGLRLNPPGVDLFDATQLLVPLNLTSARTFLGHQLMYTGDTSPRETNEACNDWKQLSSNLSVAVGFASEADGWFYSDGESCVPGGHIYCLEE